MNGWDIIDALGKIDIKTLEKAEAKPLIEKAPKYIIISGVIIVAAFSAIILLHNLNAKPNDITHPIFVLAATGENGVIYEYDDGAVFNTVASTAYLRKCSRDMLVQDLKYKNWDDYVEHLNKDLLDSGYKNWDEYFTAKGYSGVDGFLQEAGEFDSIEEWWEYSLRNPPFDSVPKVFDIEQEFGELPVFCLEIRQKDLGADPEKEYVAIPAFADGGMNNKKRKFFALPRWQVPFESKYDDCVFQLWGWCTDSEDYVIKIKNSKTDELIMSYYINVRFSPETQDYIITVKKR